MVTLSLHLKDNDAADKAALVGILNGNNATVIALREMGWRISDVDHDGEFWILDFQPEPSLPLPPLPEPTRPQTSTARNPATAADPVIVTHAVEEQPVVAADSSPPETVAQVSAQALAVRRGELRKVIAAIAQSDTGRFDDIYSSYMLRGKYGRNRFGVWMWLFEHHEWIRFTDRWHVTHDPTDDELSMVITQYLERKGNWDQPGAECAKDLAKRETTRQQRTPILTKPVVEMSWQEMRQAYAQQRAAQKEEPRAITPPVARPSAKPRRFDWDKLLAGVWDILHDATDPLTATEVRRRLGDGAPDLANLIYYMERDGRFVRGEKKLWRLADEEPAAPQDAEPADQDDEEAGADADDEAVRVVRSAKRKGPVTMIDPSMDEERMAKWRRELGPEKRRYQDDDHR